ncbi:Succinate-semialdehyde dehydrogenase [Fusarium oxysporum f. sp. albedinis]|nr:Succinate-semialdehyde dehydrogenase [Fusarium oxysporum f. sp. albedinis]
MELRVNRLQFYRSFLVQPLECVFCVRAHDKYVMQLYLRLPCCAITQHCARHVLIRHGVRVPRQFQSQ